MLSAKISNILHPAFFCFPPDANHLGEIEGSTCLGKQQLVVATNGEAPFHGGALFPRCTEGT